MAHEGKVGKDEKLLLSNKSTARLERYSEGATVEKIEQLVEIHRAELKIKGWIPGKYTMSEAFSSPLFPCLSFQIGMDKGYSSLDCFRLKFLGPLAEKNRIIKSSVTMHLFTGAGEHLSDSGRFEALSNEWEWTEDPNNWDSDCMSGDTWAFITDEVGQGSILAEFDVKLTYCEKSEGDNRMEQQPLVGSCQESYSRMLAEGIGSDCTIKVGQDSIKAHKCILAARSPVFRRMFSNPDYLEWREGIRIQGGIQSHSVRTFLQYLYTGSIGDYLSNDSSCAVEMLRLADYYDVILLKNQVAKKMAADLLDGNGSAKSISDLCDLLRLIEFIPCDILKEACIQFFHTHRSKVIVDDAWANLKESATGGKLAADLLEWTYCTGRRNVDDEHDGSVAMLLDGRLHGQVTKVKKEPAVRGTEANNDDVELAKHWVDSVKELLTEGIHSDCAIQVGQTKFTTHLAILTHRCPALMEKLDGVGENGDNAIRIDGYPADAVSVMLNYIYTGSTPLDVELDRKLFGPLLRLASGYNLLDLLQYLEAKLLGHLTVSNFFSYLNEVVSDSGREGIIPKACARFFSHTYHKLMATAEWAELKKNGTAGGLATKLIQVAFPPPSGGEARDQLEFTWKVSSMKLLPLDNPEDADSRPNRSYGEMVPNSADEAEKWYLSEEFSCLLPPLASCRLAMRKHENKGISLRLDSTFLGWVSNEWIQQVEVRFHLLDASGVKIQTVDAKRSRKKGRWEAMISGKSMPNLVVVAEVSMPVGAVCPISEDKWVEMMKGGANGEVSVELLEKALLGEDGSKASGSRRTKAFKATTSKASGEIANDEKPAAKRAKRK